MEFLNWCADHWLLAWCFAWPVLFLAWAIVSEIFSFLCWPFRLINRWIRHRNIVVRGWPPEHLDADGDFKPEPEAEEASA